MGFKVGKSDFDNNSFLLDGVDEYINADFLVSTISSDTKGTINVLVKSVNQLPSSTAYIFSFADNSGPNTHININQQTDGKIQTTGIINSTKFVIRTDNAIDLTNWTLISLVQNGSQPVIYINGVAVGQTNITSNDLTIWFSTLTNFNNVSIGGLRSSSTLYDFVGYVASVSYINTNLSAAQVLDLYNNGQPKDPSILFGNNCKYLAKFANSSWDSVNSQYNIVNQAAPPACRKSLKLDGVDERLSVPYDDLNTYIQGSTCQFTWLFSCKHDSVYSTAGHQPLFSNWGAASNERSISLRFNITTQRLQMEQMSGSTSVSAFSTETFVASGSSDWYHGAVTYDYSQTTGNRCDMYVNGNALTVTDNLTNYFNTSSRTNEVGRYYTFGHFDGYINSLTLINRPITQTEYNIWYNNGNPINPKHVFGTDCVWFMNPDEFSWGGSSFSHVDQGVATTSVNMEEIDKTNIAPNVMYSVSIEQGDLIQTGKAVQRLNTQGRLKINN